MGGQKGLANLGEVLMHIVIACGQPIPVIKWTGSLDLKVAHFGITIEFVSTAVDRQVGTPNAELDCCFIGFSFCT